MLELVFFIVVIVIFWQVLSGQQSATGALARRQLSPQLTTAIGYADRLYDEHRFLAAEKAYLAVLKLDHKNLMAYNRLGIIYSAQKNMADAIECFEIATRLRPSSMTYLNLGIGFYENRNYIKSIAAIKKAIMFEPSAHRYIALAKAYSKITDTRSMIEALEHAVELDPSRSNLTLLRDAYYQAGKKDHLATVTERLKSLGGPGATTVRRAHI